MVAEKNKVETLNAVFLDGVGTSSSSRLNWYGELLKYFMVHKLYCGAYLFGKFVNRLTVDGLRSVNLSFVDCQTLGVFGGGESSGLPLTPLNTFLGETFV